MPVLASKIKTILAAALDAEGSDRYKDAQDYIPAINYAIGELVDLVNKKKGSVKFTAEAQRELRKAQVYLSSKYSRIAIPDSIWTVDSVIIGITTIPTPINLESDILTAPAVFSWLFEDLAFDQTTGIAATRKTDDQWNSGRWNPLEAGYVRPAGSLTDIISYAYTELMDYSSADDDVYPTSAEDMSTPPTLSYREIEIRPYVLKQFVGIKVVKNFTPVASISDPVQVPTSMTNLMAQLALGFISFKQGDNTTINLLSGKSVNEFISNW